MNTLTKNFAGLYNSGLDFYIPDDKDRKVDEHKSFHYDDSWFGEKNRFETDYTCWKRYRRTQWKEHKHRGLGINIT